MKNYIRGIRAGIPIALGYLSVPFTFGIMAVSYGLFRWQAVLISMFTVTSAGQKTAPKFCGIYRWLLGFMMTDEVFAVASRERIVKPSAVSGSLPAFFPQLFYVLFPCPRKPKTNVPCSDIS